jgi:hypothetical protein
MKNKTTYQLDFIIKNKRFYPPAYLKQAILEMQARRKAREIKAFAKKR